MGYLNRMKSRMRCLDWQVSMFHIHLQRFLWMYCPGHARVKRHDWANRVSRQGYRHKWFASWKIWSVEELDALRHSYRHKAKDITTLISWRRKVYIEKVPADLPWKDKVGPQSIRPTLELFERQHWGHPCPCQKCSQESPAKKTGRRFLLNRP